MTKSFDPSQHVEEHTDGYIVPPADEYIVRIEEAQLKSSAAGNPYINLALRIAHGVFENSMIWDICSLLDRALWRLGDCCKSVGQTNVFDIESQAAIRKALEGKVGKVKTKVEEYQGQERARVARWIACTDEERAMAGGAVAGGSQCRQSAGSDDDDGLPF